MGNIRSCNVIYELAKYFNTPTMKLKNHNQKTKPEQQTGSIGKNEKNNLKKKKEKYTRHRIINKHQKQNGSNEAQRRNKQPNRRKAQQHSRD